MWLCLLLIAWPVHGLEPGPEHEIKAAYIYNFLKFVQWPEDQFMDPASPFRICIQGGNSFSESIDELQRRRVADRELVIVQLAPDADVQECHVIVIGQAPQAQVEHVLQRVRLYPVLTVSDVEGFATRGGIIGFVSIDERVHLEINLNAARAAGLKISAKLLELANIVECGTPC